MFKNIHNHFNLQSSIKHWIAICFLLVLVAKPIVQSHLILEGVKSELIETSEKEIPLEDKTPSDFEDEVKYYYSNFNAFQLFSKDVIISSYGPKAYLNYNLDILLPPPRI